MSVLQIAAFRTDVTPPIGHPLCAGWLSPAVGIADPLYAGGVILTDGLQIILLLTIDWCEISNRTYLVWQERLSRAVGTTPTQVTIHCTHPHCTPWPDAEVQRLVESQTGIADVMDTIWCEQALEHIAQAAEQALDRLQPVTHIGAGSAEVKQVASNRRIFGEDGKVRAVRWTRTFDPAVRAEPEGQIDPWLKSVTFWNQNEKIAVLHYYAVHPSSYEDCFVTPDFTGLARDRRIREDNGTPHFYFTECAGDITAGKYNDGARELREVFTDRIHRAMLDAEDHSDIHAASGLRWQTHPISLPPREDISDDELVALVKDISLGAGERSRAAFMLAYRERQDVPITISALHFSRRGGADICIVHLPGESFMEYQHFAQQQRPDAFVAVPSYGDCGPGYICLERSYAEGGYEPTDSFIAGCSETFLKNAIAHVMTKPTQ